MCHPRNQGQPQVKWFMSFYKKRAPLPIVPALLAAGLCWGALTTTTALAEDDCARDPNRMSMVIQLTRTGQEKISRVAIETIRRSMDKLLENVPADIPEVGADPKICKRPDIDHLSPDKISNNCFGLLPEALWNGSLPNAKLDRLEPVQLKMNKFKIKHLALNKKPSVKCQHNVCEVDTTIDQLNMGFDITARSVNESCDQVGLKNVALNLNSKTSKDKPAKVRFKFRFTNDIAHPIEIDWDDAQINVPVESLNYQAKSVTDGQNLCKRNQGIQKVVSEIAGDLVAKNQFVTNTILDLVKDSVLKSFIDQEIVELAQANGLGKEKYINASTPNIKNVVNKGVIKAATKQQIILADDYLNKIRSAPSGPDLAKTLPENIPSSNVAEYIKSFKSSKTEKTHDFVQALSEKWISNLDELSRLEAKANDPHMKSLLRREQENIKLAVKDLERFRTSLSFEINPNGDEEKLALVLTALQANDLQSAIESKISACYRCRNLGILATSGADWGFENGDHDIAFKTGYGSINQLLAVMQESHSLDTCVIQGARRDCKDARPDDVKIDVRFSSAPEIFWNPASNSFAFGVKQIELVPQNGGLAMIGRKLKTDVLLPGTLTVENDGKTIRFTPIQSQINVNNPDFKAANWDPTKVLSGVVAWVAEKMANTAFAHRKMKDALTIDVDLPENSKLSQVKATPQGFAVYMNLPSDPNLMLPPEKPVRTLAALQSEIKAELK